MQSILTNYVTIIESPNEKFHTITIWDIKKYNTKYPVFCPVSVVPGTEWQNYYV